MTTGSLMIDTIQWISVGLSLSGMFLVIHKYRIGFVLWMVASLTWLYIFYVKDVGPRMIVEIVYALQATYGFWLWGKK